LWDYALMFNALEKEAATADETAVVAGRCGLSSETVSGLIIEALAWAQQV
jgi:hypothetical protein